MYDTAKRVDLVIRQANQLLRRKEKRRRFRLTALCCVLMCSLGGAFFSVFHSTQGVGTVPGLYGSMLLYEEAGGYVLVGVLSFVAAVVLTVLCMRNREKSKQNSNTTEDDKK